MNLKVYAGKKVRLETMLGDVIEGMVSDYCYADEDDTNQESIVVDAVKGVPYHGCVLGLYAKDIKAISIIE